METAPSIFCWKCGTENEPNAWRCVRCGEELHQHPSTAVQQDGLVEHVIPYRNTYALFAYYMGVFAAIPCFGFLLGPIAFFLGLAGLRHANAHPESHGKVHAWLGIVLGGIFGLVYIAGALYFFSLMATRN